MIKFILLLMMLCVVSCATPNNTARCDDCIQGTNPLSAEQLAQNMHQRALKASARGQAYESSNKTSDAFMAYTLALGLIDQLAKNHPKSHASRSVKNTKKLGKMNVEDIERKVHDIRNQTLILSGVLGWAQYRLEAVPQKYRTMEFIIHLSETYAELNDLQNVIRMQQAFNELKGTRATNDDIQTLKKQLTTQTARYKKSAKWTGCLLNPGLCDVLLKTSYKPLIAPFLPPTIHRYRSYLDAEWGQASKRIRDFLNINQTQHAFKLALLNGDHNTSTNQFLLLYGHAVQNGDAMLANQTLQLFQHQVARLPSQKDKMRKLQRFYELQELDQAPKSDRLKILKQIEALIKKERTPRSRMKLYGKLARQRLKLDDLKGSQTALKNMTIIAQTFQFKTKIETVRIISLICNLYIDQKNIDEAWRWYRKIELVADARKYLRTSLLEAQIKQGQSIDFNIIKEMPSSDAKVFNLFAIATAYLEKGKKDKALKIAKLIEKTLKTHAKNKTDLRTVSFKYSLITLYINLKKENKTNMLIVAMIKNIQKRKNMNIYEKGAYISALCNWLQMSMAQNNQQLYTQLFSALKRTSYLRSYMDVLKPLFIEYLKTKKYEDIFRLIENTPKAYLKIRGLNALLNYYMGLKPAHRDPKLAEDLLLKAQSYITKPKDLTNALPQLSRMCADPKVQCLDQLTVMTKHVQDQSKRKDQKLVIGALADEYIKIGELPRALELINLLKNDKNKAAKLGMIALFWGKTKKYYATYPGILKKVQNKAKSLPVKEHQHVENELISAYARVGWCSKVVALSKTTSTQILKSRSNHQEDAAVNCLLRGDVISAINIARMISHPDNKTNALIKIGFFIDGSGYNKMPKIKKILREVARKSITQKPAKQLNIQEKGTIKKPNNDPSFCCF